MQNHSTPDTHFKRLFCAYRSTCLTKTKDCEVHEMNSTTKILVPNKEWLIQDNKEKIGSISKNKKGYTFLRNGKSLEFKDLAEVKKQFGIALFEESIKKHKEPVDKNYSIYDFPCRSKPFDPVYSVKKKLPLFSKSSKSKSQYCAGYYIISRRKGWATSFCPKLITLDRYPYYGPFKTEVEMKAMLSKVDKL